MTGPGLPAMIGRTELCQRGAFRGEVRPLSWGKRSRRGAIATRSTTMNWPFRRLRSVVVIVATFGLAGCGGSMLGSTVPAILFSPLTSNNAYLITLDGHELHEWHTDFAPGYSVYLLPNGNLLRANSIPGRPFSTLQGSNGGRVEMLDWDSN